jgi:predicted  nucleic acid-binding Zn-ribbon protein
MTDEERDKLLDFIVDQQIKIQNNIIDLSMAGIKTDRRIRRLGRAMDKHQEWLSSHTFEIQSLENKLSEITDKINFIIDREIGQRITRMSNKAGENLTV